MTPNDKKSYAALLSELTLQEKISLLSGNTFNTTPSVPRLGIPQIKVGDSINGIRPSAIDGGMATACFPSTTCLASTWDVELLERMGAEIAQQARLKSAQVVLGPTINIHRDPRSGRNFECFSEDPLLSGQLAGAIVNGIQKQGVGACPKHFVCNDSETMRHFYNVNESPNSRTLREIYLAAWQHLLRTSDPVGIMTAYNKVNGLFCGENKELISDILRGTWGYQGITMSDWFATHSTVPPIKAGLDLEMPFPFFRGGKLLKEVKVGNVAEAEIDQRALKMLELRDRTQACHQNEEERSELSDETNRIARELAAAGIVLLKNDNNVLPLSTTTPFKVAVIGEFAYDPVVTGGGSASCKPQYKQRPLDALQTLLSPDSTIRHSPGVRTRCIIPVAPTTQLTSSSGHPGADVSYFNDSAPSTPLLTELLPSPHVFMLGAFKPGLSVPSSRLEITTTLTPLSTGPHILAVRCTGAFTLTVDGAEPVLARDTQADVTTEQFLFNPTLLESRATLDMTAGQPYKIHLAMRSREALTLGEPTPYAATICFEEFASELAAIADAEALAAESDVSLVFCGRSDQYESEGFDLEEMALPRAQVDLLRAVARAGKRTVVVLYCGNPIELPEDVVGAVEGVVLAHFPGQEGGMAVGEVLTGKVNPSGRLGTSWWRTLGDAPSEGWFPAKRGEDGEVEIRYGEGVGVGYRSDGVEKRVRWPFGFGLSYTEFGYHGLKVVVEEEGEKPVLRCQIGVTNMGEREGKEVVRLYVGAVEAAVWRPERELKAFTKVLLQPGERKVVELEVDLKVACSYWDETGIAWKTEMGRYRVEVGGCREEVVVTKEVSWNHL
ncbi:beta-glucosidase [Staphylotrichum tortipilum]|uniref:beta-glucosidase n=1 Tax=Staphylotrichum tortipilum TaxID=2831512 RepID=A0AAN6RSW3_9PEZI|nr:beta-glucosidase [Staphylotrichum longicolle]